eukprot:gene16246-19280_t
MSATLQVDTPLRKRKLVESLEDEPPAVRACREEDAENTQPFASSDKVGAGWRAADDASVADDGRLSLSGIASVKASAVMAVGTKRRINEAFDEAEEADRAVAGKRYRPALNSMPALRRANLPSKRPPRRHLRRGGQHSGMGCRGLGVLQRPLHCARVDQLSGAAISAAAATAPEFEELQAEMLPEELQCAMTPATAPVVVSSLPTTANLAAGSALTSNGAAASSAPLASILGGIGSAPAAASEPPAAGGGVMAALLEMHGGEEKGRKRRGAKAKGGGTADPSASLGGLQAGPAISFTGLPAPAVDAAAGAAPPMLFGTAGKDGAPGTSAGGTAIAFGTSASLQVQELPHLQEGSLGVQLQAQELPHQQEGSLGLQVQELPHQQEGFLGVQLRAQELLHLQEGSLGVQLQVQELPHQQQGFLGVRRQQLQPIRGSLSEQRQALQLHQRTACLERRRHQYLEHRPACQRRHLNLEQELQAEHREQFHLMWAKLAMDLRIIADEQ